MARIVSFTVHGLAGRHKPYSASLQDVNVFFGINGSGKTTLLKILHSALSTNTEILKGLPFKSAEVAVHLNRYKQVFSRRISLQGAGPEEGTEDQSEETTAEPRFSPVSLTTYNHLVPPPRPLRWASEPEEPTQGLTQYDLGYLPITRLYRTIRGRSGSRAISEDELDSRFAAEVQRRWTEYQADISTRVSEVQGSGLAEILHLVLSGRDESIRADSPVEISDAYQRVSAFLGRQPGFARVLGSREDFESKYTTQPQIKNVVKEIDRVEERIEKITAPRLRFQQLLESMYSGNKRITFSEKDVTIEAANKDHIGLPSLSSGEKQLFFIALEAIRSGNSSLIIDEPELSMHVDWQKTLVTSLRALNPKMQLIMATHSPEIMADLPDEKIFNL
jgi:energy-coupling factor transporter ATP-binding protein EcfA2